MKKDTIEIIEALFKSCPNITYFEISWDFKNGNFTPKIMVEKRS